MRCFWVVAISLAVWMGPLWAQREVIGDVGTLYNAAISPDERYMAVSHGGGVSLYSFPGLVHLGDAAAGEGTPWALAFSPDGGFLACGTSGGEVSVLAVPSLEVVHSYVAPRGYIWSLAFSPGGRYLATSSWDGDVVLWDTATWEQVVSYPLGEKVWALAFSPRGDEIAIGTADGIIVRPVAGDGEGHRLVTGSGVWALAFGPGFLAWGEAGGDVSLWSPATGEVKGVGGHKGAVWGLGISPDGDYLLSVSLDATARLWGLPDGDPVAVLDHGGPLRFGAFLGKGFLTVTESGEVSRWDLGELLGLRPRILGVGYSSRVKVGRTQLVSVSFSDADGNVSRAVLRLVRSRESDLRVEPGLNFPLAVE